MQIIILFTDYIQHIDSVFSEIISNKPALGQLSCFEPAKQLHTRLIFQDTRVSLGITELYATAQCSVSVKVLIQYYRNDIWEVLQ